MSLLQRSADYELTRSSAQLYDEQKKMFQNSDGTWRDVTYESTKEMPLMDAVIRETLRMVSFLLPNADVTQLIMAFPLSSTHQSTQSTEKSSLPSLYHPHYPLLPKLNPMSSLKATLSSPRRVCPPWTP